MSQTQQILLRRCAVSIGSRFPVRGLHTIYTQPCRSLGEKNAEEGLGDHVSLGRVFWCSIWYLPLPLPLPLSLSLSLSLSLYLYLSIYIRAIQSCLGIHTQIKKRPRRHVRSLRKHTFFFLGSDDRCDLKLSDPGEAGKSFAFFIMSLKGILTVLSRIYRGCFIESQFLASLPKRFLILHPPLWRNMKFSIISNQCKCKRHVTT